MFGRKFSPEVEKMIAEENGQTAKAKAKAKVKMIIKGEAKQPKLTTKVMGKDSKGAANPTPFITAKT